MSGKRNFLGVRAELKRLQQENILWLDQQAPKSASGYDHGLLANGWFVDPKSGSIYRRWHPLSSSCQWCRLAAPSWAESQCDLPLDASTHSAQMSPSGKYLARIYYRGDWRVSVWDRQENSQLTEYNLGRHLQAFAFSADEQHLFASTVVDQIPTLVSVQLAKNGGQEKQVLFKSGSCWIMAPHPAGRWVAVELGGSLGLVDWESPTTVQIRYVGGAYNFGAVALKELKKTELQQQLQQMENQLPVEKATELREMYKAQLDVAARAGLQPKERIAALEFTPDGQWLICATNEGIRVFGWEKVLNPAAKDFQPDYSVEAEPFVPEDGQDEYGAPAIHSIAFDPDRKRVLFGGAEGKLKYLSLDDNRSGDLLTGPERSPITRIELLPKRDAVVITRRPDVRDRARQREKFQIWNYAALCQANGISI